eukprot:GHVT01045422.1.p1 GENE.GHVT01045422.1~~GHVT01045422.1.p1  ORF type:complete len:114 (+),score=26.03 GHVT01045422.1:151-492(+)
MAKTTPSDRSDPPRRAAKSVAKKKMEALKQGKFFATKNGARVNYLKGLGPMGKASNLEAKSLAGPAIKAAKSTPKSQLNVKKNINKKQPPKKAAKKKAEPKPKGNKGKKKRAK